MNEHQLFTDIEKSANILLISHRHPDGDTLGAASGLADYISNTLQKNVSLFCLDPLPANLGYLNLEKRIINAAEIDLNKFDLIIALDCADEKQTGLPEIWPNVQTGHCPVSISKDNQSIRANIIFINIDHHKTNANYADLNIVDTNASSTSEIIYRLFKKANIPLTKQISSALLTGIVTDTAYFSNGATNKNAMNIASNLLKSGANFRQILNSTLRNYNALSLNVWGKILSQLQYSEKYKIACALITAEDQVEAEAFDGLANFLMSLYEPNIIIVIKEEKNNMLKFSLRATKDNIDVSKAAQYFGGGGHQKAAGFSIKGRLQRTEEGWKII